MDAMLEDKDSKGKERKVNYNMRIEMDFEVGLNLFKSEILYILELLIAESTKSTNEDVRLSIMEIVERIQSQLQKEKSNE